MINNYYENSVSYLFPEEKTEVFDEFENQDYPDDEENDYEENDDVENDDVVDYYSKNVIIF